MIPDLWTDEYFICLIERKVKYDIDMKFYVKESRKPTKEEYESTFKCWVGKLRCVVTDYDLGKYDETNSRENLSDGQKV